MGALSLKEISFYHLNKTNQVKKSPIANRLSKMDKEMFNNLDHAAPPGNTARATMLLMSRVTEKRYIEIDIATLMIIAKELVPKTLLRGRRKRGVDGGRVPAVGKISGGTSPTPKILQCLFS